MTGQPATSSDSVLIDIFLSEVMPFSLLVDHTLNILRTGPSLEKVLQREFHPGQHISLHFGSITAEESIFISPSALAKAKKIRLIAHELTFICALHQLDAFRFILLLNPVINNFQTVTRLNLHYNDFPRLFPTFDTLMMLAAAGITHKELEEKNRLIEESTHFLKLETAISKLLIGNETLLQAIRTAGSFLVTNQLCVNCIFVESQADKPAEVIHSVIEQDSQPLQDFALETIRNHSVFGSQSEPMTLDNGMLAIQIFASDSRRHGHRHLNMVCQLSNLQFRDTPYRRGFFNNLVNLLSETGINEALKARRDEIDLLSQEITSARAAIESTKVIVHEISTPLTALKGRLELALQSCTHQEHDASTGSTIQTALAKSLKSVERIGNILDNFREASDTDTIIPNLQTGNLLEIVSEALEIAEFCLSIDASAMVSTSGVDCEVYCDTDISVQILVNLLKNALESSLAGGTERIEISAHRVTQEDQAFIDLHVDSVGPPIPDDILKGMFKSRVSARLTPSNSGFGLLVSRKLARVQRGDLAYERTSLANRFCLRLVCG